MSGLALLAFGAHPDDAELSCGGWLARAATSERVGIVDLTSGELASNGTPAVRAEEARAAARALGVELRECLGLPDGGLRGDDAEQVDAVVGALRRLRPELVVGPWLRARHPDHSAAGRLVERACFVAGLVKHRPDLGAPWRPLRLVRYPQRHELRPDFVVDVTAVYEQKRAAIACHASQLGGTPTMVNDPVGLGAFEARDRYWGASIGVAFGEPYALSGPVPLGDPVAHFRAHPHPPTLVPDR